MFSNITGQSFLILIAGVIGAYYSILALCWRRGNKATLSMAKGQVLQSVQADRPNFPHELVARPLEMPGEGLEILLGRQPEDESKLEMLDDDDGILVKEAERVVEQIQDTINHIASHPANPEEVFTKIRTIVSQYKIFMNTEYYEPINRFIALTVNRDCDIQWTEQDLIVLWT